jgi:G:T-mismatch repair DNA endonuclease (very short patch repair protein)
MTNTERQREFKERMYEAGYKQKIVWVLRNPEEEKKLNRSAFLKRFDKLTSGWSAGSLSELCNNILSMVTARKGAQKDK